MTIPRERYDALQWAQDFLYDLLDPKKTPKIPLKIRRRARNVLRHYPGEFDRHLLRLSAPKMLGGGEQKTLHQLIEGKTLPVVVFDVELRQKWIIEASDWAGYWAKNLETGKGRILPYGSRYFELDTLKTK